VKSSVEFRFQRCNSGGSGDLSEQMVVREVSVRLYGMAE
jgi:hypothetical protein